MAKPKYKVRKWEKTGGWHYAVIYTPTDEDRRAYFKSYPPGDVGPFYVNADCGPTGFYTEEEAVAAAELVTKDWDSQPWPRV